MKYRNVIVTGSIAYDTIMSMPGRFKEHILPDKLHIINVSFIMKTLRREFGGTGGNIAYSLSLLTIPTHLIGAVGNDFGEYHAHLHSLSHLNITGIREHDTVATAAGFVMTDQDDNQIWGFYEGAMKRSRGISLRRQLGTRTFLVIAPNDPAAMMRYVREAVSLRVPFLFDPAFNIPHFSITDLRFAVAHALVVIGNDYEISLLRKRLKFTSSQLFTDDRIVITTLGAKGSQMRQGKEKFDISPARPKNTNDPTGAGDAYRAGFIAGFVRGYPLTVCGRMGSVAAVYTVEKHGTQTHRFTVQEFEKRYLKNYGEQLHL